jgi:ribosomal protein S18 acetylase RimI-like enzyme
MTEDERRLASLDRATWAPENSPIPLWDESVDFFSSDPVEDVIVADCDGIPIGYVNLRRMAGEKADSKELMISGIAVEPEQQRQGIGSRLVAEAIEEGKRRGAVRLSLHVLGTNEAAIGLYESHAFRIAEVQSGAFVIDGNSVDDLVMERNPL